MKAFWVKLALSALTPMVAGSPSGSHRALAWAGALYSRVPLVPTAGCDSPRERFGEAYDAARQAIRKYGPNYDRLALLGQCEMRLGSYAKAAATFAAAAKLRPNDYLPQAAEAKARQYRAAASLLADLDHHQRPVQEVVRIPASGDPEFNNACWLGVLVGERDPLTYGRDIEVDIFADPQDEPRTTIAYSLKMEEVGEFYTVNAIDLIATGRSQVVFRGIHRLGDGSRSGRVIVLDQVHDKWTLTFDKEFFGTAWLSDPSHTGHWSILIENPLHWRSSTYRTDAYNFAGGKWRKTTGRGK